MDIGTVVYEYSPLQSKHHIRLLQVEYKAEELIPQNVIYRIIQRGLFATGEQPPFEAVSYTWGNPERVATLAISKAIGSIVLTKNLAEALPYLAKHPQTKLLWLDQICKCCHRSPVCHAENSASINQNDDLERHSKLLWCPKSTNTRLGS